MKRAAVLWTITGALLLGGASDAAADPFVVRPPSVLTLDFEGDGFRFVGDGFDIATAPLSVGAFISRIHDPSCDPCRIGELYDAGFRTRGEVFLDNGSATFNGVRYPDVALFGTLAFDATPVALGEPASDGIRLMSPFTFAGVLRGVAGGEQVFAADFSGSGRAQRFFDFSRELGLYFAGENQERFVFEDTAPVPEPATMLLLTTGAAIAGAFKRRRHAER